MSFEHIVYPGFYTEEAKPNIDHAMTGKLGTLVREVNHKFGLLIHSMTVNGMIMCRPDGVMAMRLSVQKDDDSKDRFCCYSFVFSKSRGRTEDARCTFYAKSLPALMKSLSAFKQTLETSHPLVKVLSPARSQAERVMRNEDEKNLPPVYFDDDLTIAMAQRLSGRTVHVDMDQLKAIVDSYDRRIERRAAREETMNKFFSNGITAIGQDGLGQFLIGEVTFNSSVHPLENGRVTFTNFKRYATIDDVPPEHIPILTMMKVSYSSKGMGSVEGEGRYVPIVDTYDKDLNVILYYPVYPSICTHAWAMFPKE